MSTPIFNPTQVPVERTAGGTDSFEPLRDRGSSCSISRTGNLTLSGAFGATPGDIPSSLFCGRGRIVQVYGGLNVAGTKYIQFVPSPDGLSLLSIGPSGVPANAPADTYLITVVTS